MTLEELPTELVNAQANVIVGRPAVKLLKSFYTVDGVIAENRDIHTPEYQTILREPVKSGTPGSSVNCIELVQYKGSWIMPNDPVMSRLLDQQAK